MLVAFYDATDAADHYGEYADRADDDSEQDEEGDTDVVNSTAGQCDVAVCVGSARMLLCCLCHAACAHVHVSCMSV